MSNFNPQTTAGQPTNTMAIVSLVAGIVSWVFLPLLSAIVGIVTGHMARNQIAASGGAEGGDMLALIGLILSYANIVLSCVSIIFALLIFGGVFGLSACAILSESTGLLLAGF